MDRTENQNLIHEDDFGKEITQALFYINKVSHFELLHLLQKNRSVWKICPEWPYVFIDVEGLSIELEKFSYNRYAVFPNCFYVQNISRKDLGKRLAGLLIGGGTDGGITHEGNHFVQGAPNPKSNYIFGETNVFGAFSRPFFIHDKHFIFCEEENVYQFLTDPPSDSIFPKFDYNFSDINEFRTYYLKNFHQSIDLNNEKQKELSELLDELFSLNVECIEAASIHGLKYKTEAPIYDFYAPKLTKYGKIAYDSKDEKIKVSHNFALLHYEKAIMEFNELKKSAQDKEKAFVHGVYCVIALGAMIESVANRIHYHANKKFSKNDKRTPIEKINEESAKIAQQNKRKRKANGQNLQFKKLKNSDDLYKSIEEIRVLRNKFLHSEEILYDIDETGYAEIVEKVKESRCRILLSDTKKAMNYILSQIPEMELPVVIKDNVSWLDGLEVP